MARRVSFSDEHLSIDEIARHHRVLEDAIALYHSASNPEFERRFQGYTRSEILEERDGRLYEAGAASALTMLASVEAAFRVDYLQRCYRRRTDDLSRAFRNTYREKGERVLFDADLLDAWKEHSNVPRRLVSEIRSAFRYRHWLAHGRYWTPKLGRQYDFASIHQLASDIHRAFPFVPE